MQQLTASLMTAQPTIADREMNLHTTFCWRWKVWLWVIADPEPGREELKYPTMLAALLVLLLRRSRSDNNNDDEAEPFVAWTRFVGGL